MKGDYPSNTVDGLSSMIFNGFNSIKSINQIFMYFRHVFVHLKLLKVLLSGLEPIEVRCEDYG